MAIALGQRLVLVRSLRDSSGDGDGDGNVQFVTATKAPEAVTALAWIASTPSGDECILVGTSEGYLQLHSAEGLMLHRQELHDRGVNSVGVR